MGQVAIHVTSDRLDFTLEAVEVVKNNVQTDMRPAGASPMIKSLVGELGVVGVMKRQVALAPKSARIIRNFGKKGPDRHNARIDFTLSAHGDRLRSGVRICQKGEKPEGGRLLFALTISPTSRYTALFQCMVMTSGRMRSSSHPAHLSTRESRGTLGIAPADSCKASGGPPGRVHSPLSFRSRSA